MLAHISCISALGCWIGVVHDFSCSCPTVGGLSSLFAVLMAGGRHIFPSRFSATAMIDDLDCHQVSWDNTVNTHCLCGSEAHCQAARSGGAVLQLNAQSTLQVSSFIAVPAMLVALCEAASSSQQRAFPHVKRVLVGGGTPTDGVLKSVRQMLPAASIKLSYAMTEAASSMTFRTLATGHPSVAAGASTRPPPAGPLPAAAVVCVGRPAPGVELDVQPAAGLPPGAFLLHLCLNSSLGPHRSWGCGFIGSKSA